MRLYVEFEQLNQIREWKNQVQNEEGTEYIFKNDDLGKFSNSLRKKYSIGDGRILRQAQYERIKRVTADRRIIVDGKV